MSYPYPCPLSKPIPQFTFSSRIQQRFIFPVSFSIFLSQYPRTIYSILIHTVYISALRFIFLHSSFRSTSCPGAYASPRILRSIFIETQRNKIEIRSRRGLGYATTDRSLRFEPFLTRGTPAKKRGCTYPWQYQVKSNSRHTPTLVP